MNSDVVVTIRFKMEKFISPDDDALDIVDLVKLVEIAIDDVGICEVIYDSPIEVVDAEFAGD